jgi:hypothetical protein
VFGLSRNTSLVGETEDATYGKPATDKSPDGEGPDSKDPDGKDPDRGCNASRALRVLESRGFRQAGVEIERAGRERRLCRSLIGHLRIFKS